MPQKYAPLKVAQARRYLSGGGVNREDSDDELGLEDHPWEWIFTDAEGYKQPKIVGARMGSFQCKLGDCVLLKAEGTSNEAWVGLICEFLENEVEEKSAHFMWFSSEKEIRNKKKKKTDVLPNELYITPSWDVNPLTTVNGRAIVVSMETFMANYPSGKVPRSDPNYGKVFLCRRGCNTRTATYTEDFVWEDLYHGVEDIECLIEYVKTTAKSTRRRKAGGKLDNCAYHSEGDKDLEILNTPIKKRKYQTGTASVSKSVKRTTQKVTTPSNKRVIIRKPLEYTPLGTRILSPRHVASSPFQIARTRLHVSAVPSSLPCREGAFASVYKHLEAAISEGTGSCIYISGTPGTGKTATVREVVAHLNAAVLAEELDDFIFVEINGMKITDPHQAYSLLWEALRGDRVSPGHALDLLEREFGYPNPRRVPCVVLMDELDQLVTKSQSIMYNFFNWPNLRHSRLIVIAVANTMDLPERTLSNKISSRLGLTRITFPGYTHDQLMKIIQSRLEGVPGSIVDPDAIQFASRKVAAVSGDARRALDICRRAVEIAETELSGQNSLLTTPSKKSKHEGAGPQATEREGGRVKISTIKQAINEATSSPLQQCLKSLPLASKLLLAASMARMRRSGISESVLGDVIEETKRLAHLADNPDVRDYLLAYNAVPGHELARSAKTQGLTTPRVVGIGLAAMELMDVGIISLEPRKADRAGKVRLNVREDELRLALKDDIEVRGLGFSV